MKGNEGQREGRESRIFQGTCGRPRPGVCWWTEKNGIGKLRNIEDNTPARARVGPESLSLRALHGSPLFGDLPFVFRHLPSNLYSVNLNPRW